MVLRRAVDQPNRWAFRRRANVNGERVAVRKAAGKLFQMNGPATVKLLIPSVVLVLGTDSIPVPGDHRCCLPSMAEIARQSSDNLSTYRTLHNRWVSLKLVTQFIGIAAIRQAVRHFILLVCSSKYSVTHPLCCLEPFLGINMYSVSECLWP